MMKASLKYTDSHMLRLKQLIVDGRKSLLQEETVKYIQCQTVCQPPGWKQRAPAGSKKSIICLLEVTSFSHASWCFCT